MAITVTEITGDAWTAITAAGTSGTSWVQKNPSLGQVVVNHSDSGSGSLEINESYFMPDNKTKTVGIPADSAGDIYYARCSSEGETAEIAADVV